eukprot:4027700-Pleurochrysis_carterae.AAC.2
MSVFISAVWGWNGRYGCRVKSTADGKARGGFRRAASAGPTQLLTVELKPRWAHGSHLFSFSSFPIPPYGRRLKGLCARNPDGAGGHPRVAGCLKSG